LASDGAAGLTAEEVADLMAPATVASLPWVRSVNEYGCRVETTAGSVARFG
jgi:hypothetical protein